MKNIQKVSHHKKIILEVYIISEKYLKRKAKNTERNGYF